MSNEKEVRPNTGTKSVEDIINEKKRKSTLPNDMYELIQSVLAEFQYDPRKIVDLTRYVLDANIDMALEDCVPMKVFFGLCGNKFEEKEDWISDKIKIMLESGLRDDKKTIAAQKGEIRGTKEYKKLVASKLRFTRLKKNCRTLESAMEMRMHIAQTKSANYRQAMSPSAYTNIKQ